MTCVTIGNFLMIRRPPRSTLFPYTTLRRRMRVGRHPLQQHLGADLGLPDRGPAEKQPLLWGVAVDQLSRRPVLGDPKRLVGDGKPAEVADVLPDGERAVDAVAGRLLR